MGEVLNSMKFIKMYAWEQPFTDAIKGKQPRVPFWGHRQKVQSLIRRHRMVHLNRVFTVCIKTKNNNLNSPY